MAKFLPYVGIAIFCGFMVTGQFLFKLASGHAKEAKTVGGMIEAIAYSPWFWTAGVTWGLTITARQEADYAGSVERRRAG
mgnify:CR=1 FL=1